MAKAPKQPGKVTHQRLNRKGLIVFGVVVVALLALIYPIKVVSDRSARQSALDQARASEKAGDYDQAIRNMGRFMAKWPNDVEGLDLQSKLLAATAQTSQQLLDASKVTDALIRIDPNGKDRNETRRRLVQLYIRYGDMMRQAAQARNLSGTETTELRYRAATTIARQILENAKDAEAHQLLGLSLDGLVQGGDRAAVSEAVQEYKAALELKPDDLVSAERLAELQLEQLKDPGSSKATMDRLLKDNPNSVPVRLARYRYFARTRQADKSLEEIDALTKMAPNDLQVQLVAASDALQRGDFDKGRRHLDAIPKADNNLIRVRALRGLVELGEKHPDEAISEWRKGLVSTGGTDTELTWQLAHTLIQLGRLAEARPLIARYQQLEGKDQPVMGQFLRALYEQRAGHPTQAIREFDRVINKIPDNWQPEAQLIVGRCYESLGDEIRAMTAYKRSALLAPSAPEPRRAMARLISRRDPVEALREMERALAENPRDPNLLVEVGRLRLQSQVALPAIARRWNGVEEILAQGEKVAPNDPTLQNLRADYLAATNHLDQAFDLLEASVKGPGKRQATTWLLYAGALDRMNQRPKALEAVNDAIKPENAGDHASLRIAKARLLAQMGQAQAARDVLSTGRENVPKSERPALAKALGDLSRELGDLDGARAAYNDWAKQLPDSSEPGLNLLSLAQSNGDDESARLGLEALRTLGGDQEPYGLAARIYELLRPDSLKKDQPADSKKLDDADKLLAQLREEAPQLTIVPLLKGMILERREQYDDAIAAYRESLKDEAVSPALPRLIDLLTRQHRYDELAALKARVEKQGGSASSMASFDQMAVSASLKAGDKEQAEKTVADLVKVQPDNLPLRVDYARLLADMGRAKEGENSLRALAKRRPDDGLAWAALVDFRAKHPDLGPVIPLYDEVRAGYTGQRLEMVLGRCRWLAGDIDGATKMYDAALARNGNDMDVLKGVVEFDEAVNRPEAAEPLLRRALKADPKTPWAARTLAMDLSAKPGYSGWDEAWSLVAPGAPGAGEAPEDRLVKATVLARSPDSAQRISATPAMQSLAEDLPASNPIAVEARVRLAQAYLEVNRPGDANRMIGPVADDSNQSNLMALALGVEAAARSRDAATAGRRFDRLSGIQADSPIVVASKGWSLMSQGKADEAVKVVEAGFDKAEADPKGELVAVAYIDLLKKFGQKDAAAALASKVAARWPRESFILAQIKLDASQYDEALTLIRAAFDAGSVREAIRVATFLMDIRKDDPKVMGPIASLTEEALKKEPKMPEVLLFAATVRHLQGRYEDEVSLYRQALGNNPPSYSFLNNMAWTLSEGVHRYDEALERINDSIRREGPRPEFLDTRGVILARLKRNDDAITDLEQSAQSMPSPTTYFHLARTYRQAGNMEKSRRYRDMARQANFNPSMLDPTDRDELEAVMGNG